MKNLILLLLIALSTSCCPKVVSTLEHATRDSTYTEVKILPVDTVVKAKAAEANVTAKVKVDETGVASLQATSKTTKQATVRVAIDKGIVKASCVCDALEVKVRLYEKEIREYKSRFDKLSERQVIKEVFVPLWVKVLAYIGASALLLLTTIIIKKFR